MDELFVLMSESGSLGSVQEQRIGMSGGESLNRTPTPRPVGSRELGPSHTWDWLAGETARLGPYGASGPGPLRRASAPMAGRP
jgi:hypothetical protein